MQTTFCIPTAIHFRKSDTMEHISLRLISAIGLVLITTFFFTRFALARTAINASSPPVIKFTPEIRLAEGTSKTDESRSQAIRQYLADIFGVSGFKTSWYDNIIDVEVTGDTATMKTNLSSGDEKIINEIPVELNLGTLHFFSRDPVTTSSYNPIFPICNLKSPI